MKDPYSSPSRTTNNEHQEGPQEDEAPLKRPSRASVQKVLDFSKAYEVHHSAEGPPIDLIRN